MNALTRLKRITFYSAIAVFVLGMASPTPAQQSGRDRMGRQSPGRNEMLPPPPPGAQGAGVGAGWELRLGRILAQPEVQKALQITDDQRKKLEDIAFDSNKQAIQQRAALQVQQLELQHLIRMDNPDRAAIDKKIQEVSQARAALTRTETNALLDARSVLTKEQKDRIGEYLRNQNRQRRQARQAGRPGVPSPPDQPPPPPPPAAPPQQR